MLIVKGEPELRHILAHLHNAIDALADGCVRVCKDELSSIEGLIMYDGETKEQEEVLKWLAEKEKGERCTNPERNGNKNKLRF